MTYQPHQSEDVTLKCLPNGLPFDKERNPRIRYVRVSFMGTSCIVTPEEAATFAAEGSAYKLEDVTFSRQEFEALPEFTGF